VEILKQSLSKNSQNYSKYSQIERGDSLDDSMCSSQEQYSSTSISHEITTSSLQEPKQQRDPDPDRDSSSASENH